MKVVVCLGSNLHGADASEMLIEANAKMLQAFSSAKESANALWTSGPYMSGAGYTNEIVELESPLSYQSLLAVTKQIEKEMGRTPQMKSVGLVPIDIDILVYNGEVMRPEDMQRDYVILGLNRKANQKG